MKSVWLGFGVLVLWMAGAALAHPHSYVVSTTDAGVFNCNVQGSGVELGGVCFPAGEITVSPATVTVNDASGGEATALLCQDADLDQDCDPGYTLKFFCGEVGADLDLAHDVLVILDGPVFGNPTNPFCAVPAIGVAGTIDHST